jgi:histidine triad (HIT) family protein
MDACLFCRIIGGELQADRLYEDDNCLIIKDIAPQAPVHVLVLPKVHFESLDKAEGGQRELLGTLLLTAAEFARKQGFAENGYRVVINTNADGGQTVFHLHVHVLAGRQFVFPPG